MRVVVNPVPAWKSASVNRRVVACLFYALALTSAAYAVLGPLAWWQRALCIVPVYVFADSALVALRGSKAREQVIASMSRKTAKPTPEGKPKTKAEIAEAMRNHGTKGR